MSDTETEQLSLVVKASGNKTYELTVASDLTISALKSQLSELSSIPASQQRLIYGGRVLKDDDTLSKYSVKSGNAIHLVKGAAPKAPAASATPAAGSPTGSSTSNSAPLAPAMASGTGTGNVLADLTGARYSGLPGVGLPSADRFGPDGGQGPLSQLDDFAEFLSNPEARQMYASLLQDPDTVMRADPRLRNLPAAEYQHMREMIQSPAFREMILNPEGIRQLARETRDRASRLGLGDLGAGGAGGLGGLGALGDFGGLGGLGGIPQAPQDTRPPEERYETQLRQLNELGFHDFDQNVQALRRSGGNVEGAVASLLGE